MTTHTSAREGRLAGFYTLVAGLGFLTDAGVLKLAMAFGLSAAVARFISLFCAMQVTFFVNGRFVFRCLERRSLPKQWAAYIAANGFGNLCNYFAFVTLVSLHRPWVSNRWIALAAASFLAWNINYWSTRLLVFRKHPAGEAAPAAAPAEEGDPCDQRMSPPAAEAVVPNAL